MRGFVRTMPVNITFSGPFNKINNYQNIQQVIRIELMKLTDNHCSYCDTKLRLGDYTPEIEHFIPKAQRQSFENVWLNLFITCPKCNKNKRDKYPKIKPLKPDSVEYQFDNWFVINFETGELEPKPNISEIKKSRVKETIKWFDFNNIERCIARLETLNDYKYNFDPNKKLSDWSYRYFIERGTN